MSSHLNFRLARLCLFSTTRYNNVEIRNTTQNWIDFFLLSTNCIPRSDRGEIETTRTSSLLLPSSDVRLLLRRNYNFVGIAPAVSFSPRPCSITCKVYDWRRLEETLVHNTTDAHIKCSRSLPSTCGWQEGGDGPSRARGEFHSRCLSCT